MDNIPDKCKKCELWVEPDGACLDEILKKVNQEIREEDEDDE